MKEHSKTVTLRFASIQKRLDEEKPKSPCNSDLLCPKLHGIMASKASLNVVLLQSLPRFSLHVVLIVWIFDEYCLTGPP